MTDKTINRLCNLKKLEARWLEEIEIHIHKTV